MPFDLQLRQRGRVRYVEVGDRSVTFSEGDEVRPKVRPVGVMLWVD